MKAKLLFLITTFLCLNLNSQTYIIDDTFESDPIGSLPNGWTLIHEGSGSSLQQVVDNPVKNGVHAFQLDGYYVHAAVVSKDLPSIPNKLTIEFWIQTNASTFGNSYGNGGIGLFNPATIWVSFIDFVNGNIVATYSNSPSTYILQPYSINTWYHIKMEHDLTTNTFQVYIDNVLASGDDGSGNTSTFPMHPSYSPVSIGLYSGVSGSVKTTFDDIKAYETTNLVAYYPFNGNANDESINSHHGTVFGASLTTDKLGNPDSAYSFDGVDDYIDIGDWENGGAMTFSFWARWDAYHNYSRIIDLGNGPSSNNIIVSQRQSNDELFFQIYIGVSATSIYNSTINLSQWDFYSATVDVNGVMTLYKNGSQIDQEINGVTPNYLLRTEQFIGKSNFGQDGYFEGAIDELKIFNKSLTASEVLDLYNNDVLGTFENHLDLNKGFYIYNNSLYFDENQNFSEINQISVYNLLGQNVYQTKSIQKEIPLTFLEQGIYILKVDVKGKISSKKMVIE